MTEDDVITRLVELHDHIQVPATPPRLDSLRGERLVRRRRTVSVLAATAVVVLTVGIAQASLSDGQRTQEPAPQPSPSQTDPPTESPPTGDEWTPERIRAEGSPGDPQGAIPTSESGLATRLYVVCDGPSCDGAKRSLDDMHVALEVIQDGRSAVFDLHWSQQPWVRVFDQDSVLVQDSEGVGTDQPVRYRLLQADGTAVPLQMVEDPAPAQPGPGVFIIDDFSGWNGGMDGVEDVYLVDDRAGTLRPLDVPDEEVRYWGPNADEFLWGVSSDCRVYWATAATLEQHRLNCQHNTNFTFMHDDWFPAGWLQPGRLVVAEQLDNRTVLHLSRDSGGTWRRIPIEDDESVADVLQQLG